MGKQVASFRVRAPLPSEKGLVQKSAEHGADE